MSQPDRYFQWGADAIANSRKAIETSLHLVKGRKSRTAESATSADPGQAVGPVLSEDGYKTNEEGS